MTFRFVVLAVLVRPRELISLRPCRYTGAGARRGALECQCTIRQPSARFSSIAVPSPPPSTCLVLPFSITSAAIVYFKNRPSCTAGETNLDVAEFILRVLHLTHLGMR